MKCKQFSYAFKCFENNTVIITYLEKITFFQFPKDEEVKARWIQNIRRDKFKPNKWSRVCSIHFPEESFVPEKKIRILKKDAIPTIFPTFPHHLQKKVKSRKLPKDRSKEKVEQSLADQKIIDLDHNYQLPLKKELKRRLEISDSKNESLSR